MTIDLGGGATAVHWIGGAPPIQQITSFTVAAALEATDEFSVKINGKRSAIVDADSTTISTALATLVEALNSDTEPEIQKVTWSSSSNALIATVKRAGHPLTITVYCHDDGQANSDAQTVDGIAGHTGSTGVDTTACSGPNFFNVAANWSTGAVPVDDKVVVYANSDIDCLYGLGNTGVSPITVRVDMSYTGAIGLPFYNENNSVEGQTRYLTLGAAADGNTDIIIGLGEGAGPKRVLINMTDCQFTGVIHNTRSSPFGQDQWGIVLKGTHASNALTVNRAPAGVAIAPWPSETATLVTTNVGFVANELGDVREVFLSNGVTATTVVQTGGTLKSECAMTTSTQYGGVHKHYNGAITTKTCLGGTFVQLALTDAIGTLNLKGPGIFDASQTLAAKAITTRNIYEGAIVLDPAGTIAVGAWVFTQTTPWKCPGFKSKPGQTWTNS